MPFQIFAFPAPLGRSFAVDHADNSPKPVPAPQDISNSLPATVDNPLVWLPPEVATAIRHMSTLCPNATEAVLARLCTPEELYALASELLQAPYALPVDDDIAQSMEKYSENYWTQLHRLADESFTQAREDLVMKRVLPCWPELRQIQYLFDTVRPLLIHGDQGHAKLSENHERLTNAVGRLGLKGLVEAHQRLRADPEGFLSFIVFPPPIVPEDRLDQLRAVRTQLTNGENIYSPDFDLQACLLRFINHLPSIGKALDDLEAMAIKASYIVDPVRFKLCGMVPEIHGHLLNQLREIGIDTARINMLQTTELTNTHAMLNAMMVQLEPLQPLLEVAEGALEAFQDTGEDQLKAAYDHLKVVLQRHPPDCTAAGLAAFTDKRTQRNLQRSIERAAQRNATAPDEPKWEQAGAFYRRLHQDSQAAGTQQFIGFVQPRGWPGFVVRWLCAQVMVSSVLASALAGIINPGR